MYAYINIKPLNYSVTATPVETASLSPRKRSILTLVNSINANECTHHIPAQLIILRHSHSEKHPKIK